MNLRHSACAVALVLLSACGSSGSDDDSPFLVIGPRWYNQQRKITAETLRDVRFANATQGIAVGDATSIYRTDDGGQTWYQLGHVPFARGGDIQALDFLDVDMHAVGRDENNLGRIWTSPDAVNWTTADQAGSGAPFIGVDVVNTGAGPNLYLYLRTDGQIVRVQGLSQDAKSVSPALAGKKTTAIDAQFSGAMAVVGTAGYFAYSTDFGATWHDWSAAPAVANPSGTGVDLFGVQIVDWTQEAFFACGANGTILTTKQDPDPDPHPELQAVTTGDATSETLRAIHFPVDLTAGWAVGDNGAIVKITGTLTSGTWSFARTNQTSGTTADLYAIDMVSATTGYAVGEGGVVLKTTNGGATWSSPLLLPAGRGRSQDLNAVAFRSDAARGLAVGQASTTPDATLLRTTDAGTTWSVHNSGVDTTEDLVAAAIPAAGSGNVAYVLGTAKLYRNLDVFGAGTWTSVANLPAGTWRTMLAPAGDGTLVLAGDNGAVAVTVTATNSPPAWIAQSVPAGTPDLKCLHAVVDLGSLTQLAVFAGGEAGALWRTELDGTWTLATLNTALGADILSLGGALGGMPGAQLFAGGSDGKIHRLTEVTQLPLVYGRQELPVPSGAGDPIAVAFPTPHFGWWLAPEGIWTTENASATAGSVLWTKSPHHLTGTVPPASPPLLTKTTTLLRGLWMDSAGVNGYAVGQTGTILRTFSGGK